MCGVEICMVLIYSMALICSQVLSMTACFLVCNMEQGVCEVCSVGSAPEADGCLCISSSNAAEAPISDVEEFVAERDTSGPVITLLGDGVLKKSSSGIVFMEHLIVMGTPYVDAGVTVFDDSDGDITSSASTYGACVVLSNKPMAGLRRELTFENYCCT